MILNLFSFITMMIEVILLIFIVI